MDEARFAKIRDELGERLDNFWKTAPIPFRKQNAGDYDIPALTLRAELAPGESGFAVHVADDDQHAAITCTDVEPAAMAFA